MGPNDPSDPHFGQPVVSAGAPVGSGPAMVMVHGRNAAPANILDLVPVLNRPAFSYIAPAAANHTWYPFSFMAEIETNEPYLSSGIRVLQRIVADLASRGVGAERVVLLGFSQGACLTAEFVVRHPAKYGGVVVFSGGAIGPAGTTWSPAGWLDAAPVFLGCSDVDPHIPKTRVDETARFFERIGGRVTERIYRQMGHVINDDEIAHAQGIMDELLTA